MNRRWQKVIGLVVETFVSTNRPVASHNLAEPLGVSSATVRNDFALLEEMGFLYQPHSAAGRLPTRDAYLAYVNQCLPPKPISQSVFNRLNLVFERSEGDTKLRLASQLVSSLSGYAAATVMTPNQNLKSLWLTSLDGGRVLLVLLLEGEVVREFIVDLGWKVERETLNYVEEALKTCHFLGEVPKRLKQLSSSPAVTALVKPLSEKWGDLVLNSVVSFGAANVLNEPESQDPGFLRNILSLLERPSVFAKTAPGQIEVMIDEPNGVSSISAGFDLAHGRGQIMLFGPTRMRYANAISVTKAISDLLTAN